MPNIASNDNWSRWFESAVQPAVDTAIGTLYAKLDEEITAKQPVCNQSGRCCKFDSFGHRLYVTGLEIARFVTKEKQRDTPEAPDAPNAQKKLEHAGLGDGLRLRVIQGVSEDACVYQVNGLCNVHAIRPLGCRIYFCEQGTEAWQQDVYERYMTALRRLHEQHALPYGYMEWRAGLAEAVSIV